MSEKSKIRIAGFHFNKGKEYVSRGLEANKMEAKEHELIFDADDDDEDGIEAKQHDLLFESTYMSQSMRSRDAEEAHWLIKEQTEEHLAMMPKSPSSATRLSN